MKNAPAFCWTIAACGLLDILLLFFMFNPFSSRVEHLRWYAEVADGAPAAEGKPSPLGVAAVRATPLARKTMQGRLSEPWP
jgi:hypothetical protein